jgi:hypothetical protein
MDDVLLLRFAWPAGHGEADGVAPLHRHLPDRPMWRAVDGDGGCVYAPASHMQDELLRLAPPLARCTRLRGSIDLAGAEAGSDAPFHYIVATDVLPEHEPEFNAWYEEEHLPGLAAVPGTVRAMRYRAEGSPRYHACYDLVSSDTLGSAAWLAVRATPWSSRVRPWFRNTTRTMYRRWK